jgi:hypothetical protein
MLRQVSDTMSQTAALRGALARAYGVLRERERQPQLALIARDLGELLGTSAVRVMRPGLDGWEPPGDEGDLPESALEMEAALLPRSLAANRSLLSSHPLLDTDLAGLKARCSADDCTVHVLLARAHGATHGVFAAHWVGRDRPDFERRFAFYYYWDLIGLAVASSNERQRIDDELAELRHAAYTDPLTGLPNAVAFEQRLREHAETDPLSIAVLDFDGMREANAALGWEAGGDALIRAVGQRSPGPVNMRLVCTPPGTSSPCFYPASEKRKRGCASGRSRDPSTSSRCRTSSAPSTTGRLSGTRPAAPARRAARHSVARSR